MCRLGKCIRWFGRARNMKFRPLTAWEMGVLSKLLEVDTVLYENIREQLKNIYASTIGQWGSFYISSVETGRMDTKGGGSLPYIGIYFDEDQVPILIAVLVDGQDRLFMVEVTRLDGEPIRGAIDPQKIVLRRDVPGPIF